MLVNILDLIYSRKFIYIILSIFLILSIAFIINIYMDFQKVKKLANYTPSLVTRIYDKNGELISELFKEKREIVKIDEMPEYLPQAFISMEDSEFYNHFGINPKGIIRAFFINIFSGRIRQGGSTITQQLAKILLTSRKRTIYRKIKEAFIALAMEFYYSKDKILELYLNQIFLGHGTYGVGSASRFYFNKEVKDLSIAEASLLATLPAAPNIYSPIKHPRRSMERHKIVLARMVDEGFITIETAESVFMDFWPKFLKRINELPPSISVFSSRTNQAPWFVEHIRRKLVSMYGYKKVYEGGLQVYTTLDLHKQRWAQKILSDGLLRQNVISRELSFNNIENFNKIIADELELINLIFGLPKIHKSTSVSRFKFNRFMKNNFLWEFKLLNFLYGVDDVEINLQKYYENNYGEKEFMNVEGCLISINPQNGYIEAMVGGSEFSSNNQLNRVFQSYRQPGSAIKPLLYTAAIDSKMFTAASTVLDSPIVYLDMEGGDWIPENYEGEYYGLVTLRRALSLSINVVSVRIADKIGIDTVINYYSKLLKLTKSEAKKRIPRNFSIALGSFEVTPFELARAYAIIANGGKDVIPYSIRYIKDKDGKVIYDEEEKILMKLQYERGKNIIQIIPESTADIIISLLQSVINSGTGRLAYCGRPCAGKTGTTSNYRDAWFVGFVPQLVTAIWVGYDGKGLSLGLGQSGGNVAAPLWREYMLAALSKEPVYNFTISDDLSVVNVCQISGLLPSSYCTNTIDELFIPGTEPNEECNICKNSQKMPTYKIPSVNIADKQKKQIIKALKTDDKENIFNNLKGDIFE